MSASDRQQTAPPPSPLDLPTIAKGTKMTGLQRETFMNQVVRAYTDDRQLSIKKICAATNRSYGAIHQLLSEAGVSMRGRGGARRASTAQPISARPAPAPTIALADHGMESAPC
ncbi:helix-turn-helix domain-containing protein [Streptomyces sp. NPDC050485]|uniref:helix-turn-helix domain-containing protein n=1 Tax=Streptomyces sp. NPDC050485 TaxID=3365617 RepID=UPI0037AE57C9